MVKAYDTKVINNVKNIVKVFIFLYIYYHQVIILILNIINIVSINLDVILEENDQDEIVDKDSVFEVNTSGKILKVLYYFQIFSFQNYDFIVKVKEIRICWTITNYVLVMDLYVNKGIVSWMIIGF